MTSEKKIGMMQTDIKYIKEKIDSIENKLDDKFVRKIEFNPVKKIVYGMLGAILLAFLGGIINLVIS